VFGVRVCVRTAATACRNAALVSAAVGEGNALYPVLCSYLSRHLASGEGIVSLGVCRAVRLCVCPPH